MTEVPLNISQLRLTRERVYYVILVLISLAIWGWLFWGLFRQTVSFIDDGADCYVRDFFGDTVTKIDHQYLFPGETCLSWEELLPSEQEKVESFSSSFSTPIVLSFLFLLQLFMHLVSIAYIRTNSIRIGSEQFPILWEATQRLSAHLGLPKTPDIFIMNGNGVLNAFATRLVFRRIIVLYSDLVEALMEDQDQSQIEAVLSHELGHHILGHTRLREWLLTANWIPFLGLPLSRAREYSADRVMKALINNQETCERALTKLAAGRMIGGRANLDAFVAQKKQEGGFFAWLSECLATHPHLINRLLALRRFQPR